MLSGSGFLVFLLWLLSRLWWTASGADSHGRAVRSIAICTLVLSGPLIWSPPATAESAVHEELEEVTLGGEDDLDADADDADADDDDQETEQETESTRMPQAPKASADELSSSARGQPASEPYRFQPLSDAEVDGLLPGSTPPLTFYKSVHSSAFEIAMGLHEMMV
jgi:hypothetical protein